MNLWAFRSRIFTDLVDAVDGFLSGTTDGGEDEVFLPRVVDALASREHISVAAVAGGCYGLTHPDDEEELRRLLASTPGRLDERSPGGRYVCSACWPTWKIVAVPGSSGFAPRSSTRPRTPSLSVMRGT